MSVLDAQRLDALLARLRTDAPATPAPSSPDPVDLLVDSFLLWESTPDAAAKASKKLLGAFVDLNELRVARAPDIIAAIGARTPRVEERAALLRRTLNDIFSREHAVTLAPLTNRPKRDAKQYLASLDGCPQFVSSRVLVVALGAHGAPVDGVILARLTQHGVFTEPVDVDRAASLLERHIRAEDSLASHLALETLRTQDQQPDTPKRRSASRRVGAGATPPGRTGKRTP